MCGVGGGVCICALAVIFKNRTKYAVIPIQGDELSQSKTEGRKGGKYKSKIFLCFQSTFQKAICQSLR